MPTDQIAADYLVVGAGAMGMAFVDTVIAESEATVVLVDRNDRPGGHWLSAYPFVRLHQPSAYYGVNSRRLGDDTIDADGWNQGFYELAGAAEICSYYDSVMRQQLLPSGRVRYLPMSEYLGEVDGTGRIRTLAGHDVHVDVRRRVVDATYLNVVVPSMRPPSYAVAPGVDCIPPNELPKQTARDRYVIVGAGKTAFDSCLWLLRHGIPPQRLTWIRPRESWLLDRATIQPGMAFAGRVISDFTAQMKAAMKAESIDDLFERLEVAGCLLRIDETVTPTMYRCAIVSQAELAQLRLIDDVVRMGHVSAIEPGRIVLDEGTVTTDPAALYVDCTGDGLGKRPPVDVFAPQRITLQPVRSCQPAFSAAVIAHVELTKSDDGERNAYCGPVPHPTIPLDWLTMTKAFHDNQSRWFADAEMTAWLSRARLNVVSHISSVTPTPEDMEPLADHLRTVNEKLDALLAQA
ncbi:NAD(P)-binding protein [Mycolicibacterium hodleri]|uniref:NAD(P)/FAD-dependent oxidoreductase n=1 Tax=Mycolicibacterium hodleri TaxID=49897 RepID=A0A502EHT2_9MYCO|nr:NAD(P)/FAD-dependent oxidoreductase [Mycolicibacterium hodleri]TPG36056.1 NAD(P)/FAD-dependent oxidoreductase [Mycolicibacterium hodleri]